MGTFTIDWTPIFLAALLNLIINFVWYSKWLFGPKWMEAGKMKESDMKHRPGSVAWAVVIALIMGLILSWFENHLCVTTVQDGMFVGFCVWLGFVLTTQTTGVVWCKKPVGMFLIETSGFLLVLLAMGGVLGA